MDLRSLSPPRARLIAAVLAVLVVAAGLGLAARPSPRHVRTLRAVPTTSSTATSDLTTVTDPPSSTTSAPAASTTTTAKPKPTTTTAATVRAAATGAVQAATGAITSKTPAKSTTKTTVKVTAATTRTVGKTAPVRPALAAGGGVFAGLGTWVDVYDWTNAYTNNKPTVAPDDVDRMADAGVQTLYIQAARGDSADDVVEADRLQAILDRAKARHLAVVAWYLPYLTNPDDDMRHIRAIAGLGVDAIGIDIEARNVTDPDERNRRLVDLSAAVRDAVGSTPVAAIVLPPVVLDVINPSYWPNFPWHDIAGFYDVWMPMGYWTNRTQASGYRDAYRYTVENVDRLRGDLGLANAVVHPVGGIGDKTTGDDVDAYVRAVGDTHSVGGSIYDYRTTAPDLWSRLGGLRSAP